MKDLKVADINNRIKFTVVIPTYNRAAHVKAAVDSVLAQTYSNFEVIVVDDGSTDNTEQVLAVITDERFKYYKKSNAERGAARNFGANNASGDYVNFFDSDDTLYPNHLQEASIMVEQNASPEFFHIWYDVKQRNGRIDTVKVPDDISTALLKGNCLSCNGVFIRKDIATKHPFVEDRRVAASEDYLLWLQLAARYTFYNSSVVTSTIIQHDERSVLNFNAQRLIQRKELMLKYLFEDAVFDKKYHQFKPSLTADAYLMIALHIALMKTEKKVSISYLFRAIFCYPMSICKRPFWGTIKHLIL